MPVAVTAPNNSSFARSVTLAMPGYALPPAGAFLLQARSTQDPTDPAFASVALSFDSAAGSIVVVAFDTGAQTCVIGLIASPAQMNVTPGVYFGELIYVQGGQTASFGQIDFTITQSLAATPSPATDTPPTSWGTAIDLTGASGPTVLAIHEQGLPGPSPWAAPVAWALGGIYRANAPASVVVYDGQTYLCVVSHVAGVASPGFEPAKFVAMPDANAAAAASSATAASASASAAGASAASATASAAAANASAASASAASVSAVASRRNRLINGQFDFWQHGLSLSHANTTYRYLADTWSAWNALGVTATVAQVAAPSGFRGQYAFNVTASPTTAGGYFLYQRMESQRCADLDGLPCVASFDIKASASAGTLTAYVGLYGNATLDDGTFSAALALVAFTLPAGGGKVSVPLTGAQTAGLKFGGEFMIDIQNSAGATINYTIGSVQLEAGSVAQPFDKYLLQAESALCEFYFQTSYNLNVAPGTAGVAYAYMHVVEATGSTPSIQCPLRTRMRAAPTVTLYSPNSGTAGKIYDSSAAADVAALAYAVNQVGFTAAVNGVSIAAGHAINVAWAASAEL